MPPIDPLILADLRGGLNDSETPHALRPDELQVCQNIDLDRSTCGGKRLGTSPVSNGYAGDLSTVTFLFRHTPSNDERLTELWMGGTTSGDVGDLDFRDADGWETYANVSFGLDTLIVASGAYALEAQSLHGKLFLAYPAESGGAPVDRLHVRQTVGGVTSFRRTGLREPAAPSVADTGSGLYEAVTRYARVRYTAQDADGVTLRRSEPSESAELIPSGNGAGMLVTRPALIGEGETHWEIELSLDDVNFYVVATQTIANNTYTDTADADVGYSAFDLSPDIGDYALIWSPKFLAADQDRLLFGGAWVTDAYKSRVGWTPVLLSPGSGNDERLETDTDPFVDLDGYDGGELTDLAGPVNGYMYAFKWGHVYRLARTGARLQAYEAVPLTKRVGALPRSVVEGVDEFGRPCLYFGDPKKGPHRAGVNGVEDLGESVRETWARINLNATLPCHAEFYPEKRQVWWWIAVDGAETPNLKIVLHVRHVRRDQDGTRRGWSTHTGKSAYALAATVYADNLADVPAADQSLHLKPYLGFDDTVASGEARLQQADVGVTDDGETYQGLMRTKAFVLNLLGKVGVTAAAIMAETVSGSSVDVTLIRDYGREEKTIAVSLTAAADEGTRIVRPLDDAVMSDVFALEVEVGDSAATANTWALDQIALQLRAEERA